MQNAPFAKAIKEKLLYLVLSKNLRSTTKQIAKMPEIRSVKIKTGQKRPVRACCVDREGLPKQSTVNTVCINIVKCRGSS